MRNGPSLPKLNSSKQPGTRNSHPSSPAKRSTKQPHIPAGWACQEALGTERQRERTESCSHWRLPNATTLRSTFRNHNCFSPFYHQAWWSLSIPLLCIILVHSWAINFQLCISLTVQKLINNMEHLKAASLCVKAGDWNFFFLTVFYLLSSMSSPHQPLENRIVL